MRFISYSVYSQVLTFERPLRSSSPRKAWLRTLANRTKVGLSLNGDRRQLCRLSKELHAVTSA